MTVHSITIYAGIQVEDPYISINWRGKISEEHEKLIFIRQCEWYGMDLYDRRCDGLFDNHGSMILLKPFSIKDLLLVLQYLVGII